METPDFAKQRIFDAALITGLGTLHELRREALLALLEADYGLTVEPVTAETCSAALNAAGLGGLALTAAGEGELTTPRLAGLDELGDFAQKHLYPNPQEAGLRAWKPLFEGWQSRSNKASSSENPGQARLPLVFVASPSLNIDSTRPNWQVDLDSLYQTLHAFLTDGYSKLPSTFRNFGAKKASLLAHFVNEKLALPDDKKLPLLPGYPN